MYHHTTKKCVSSREVLVRRSNLRQQAFKSTPPCITDFAHRLCGRMTTYHVGGVAPCRCCCRQAFLPLLRAGESPGRIVNIGAQTPAHRSSRSLSVPARVSKLWWGASLWLFKFSACSVDHHCRGDSSASVIWHCNH